MAVTTIKHLNLRQLSPAQSGIWFAQMLDPQSPVYNVGEYLEIMGAIDLGLFETALRWLVAESDALHLRFVETDEGPRQYIGADPDWLMPFVDVSAEADPRAAAEAWMHDDLARVVDLAQGPFFGYALLRAAPDSFFWYARTHHLCNDGFGFSLMAQRLARLYSALVESRPPETRNSGSWFDLLDEEEDYRLSAAFVRDHHYWREKLVNRPEPVTLSGKLPARSRGFIRFTDHISPSVVDELRALGVAHKASLPEVVMAASALYLYRLTGESDLTLGMPVSARIGASMRRTLGMVSNVLPLRLGINPKDGLGTLLEQVSGGMRQILRHQRYRAEDLRHDLRLRPEELEVYGTVVNIMPFNYDLRFAGCRSRAHNLSLGPVGDLSINLYDREDGSGMRMDLDANPTNYTTEAVAGHQRRFLTLLAQLSVASPDVPLHQLEILGPGERQMLLESFNATARPLPEATLPELFEAQVARAPEATALVFGEESLTYQELNVRANRLAHHLIGLGVGPESLVGICLERSIEMVVALLSILKAGGAYLPLAVDLPALRRENLVADAGLGHMVTREGYRRFYEDGIKHVVTLDGDAAGLASQPESNPRVVLAAARPAYVNYTSGSTGQPKGVLVPHGAVVRLVHEPNYVRLDSLSRLLQLAPLSFDAATFEIWGALLNGGTLVVMLPGPVSPENIGEVLTRHQVNTVWLTAGLFNQMVDNALPALSGVRQLLAGGDVLSVDHVQKVRGAYPQCQLINGYGPTENTTFSCCHRVPAEEDLSNGVPIGRPITNSICYVLDAGLEPMPIGVIGELYVAGAGLARGYLNRPGLTAERFVADPHAREPSTRMYRTGDLARWRADGTLEFLGRVDQQVKIRGFRIELGEIEAALSAQPAVAQVAVIAREDGPGGKQLVAYVVAAAGKVAEEAALRRELGQRLPDYMVPAAFVFLEALPLTVNGKLDRRALPAPERHSEDYRGPRTPAEEVLCGLFAEVLKLERVSIEDNFFALGGHSLLATRLVSRVRTTLGVELAIRTLFEAPTVAELAQRLRASAAVRPALVRQVRPEQLPLSYAQQRLWFLHRLEGSSATYNIPIALRLDGDLDSVALEAALADVVGRHESLRTIFSEAEGMPFQKIVSAEQARPVLLSEVVAEAALASRLTEVASTGIELSREIPLRAWLLQLEPQRHVLVLLLHHIAGDGWSMGPLSRDLAQAYAARTRDEVPAFAELAVQYADYAVWQREVLGEQSDPKSLLSEQLGFWRKALLGAPEELNLPTDRPRPPVISYRGATVPVRLDAELHQRLRDLAQASGASLFMVLHAGLAALLSRLGAGEDIPIGSPIAGRGEQALENLVGFFVNTLVLRTDLSGDPSFSELLTRVRSFDLEAYEHQEVPFEQVVEALAPARSLARHPLFQVMLVLQNAPEAELVLPGLAVRPEAVMLNVTKFELTIGLGERLGAGGQPLGIEGELEYSVDLFERETVEAMAARFVRLLEGAVASPDVPLHQLEILSAEERQMLLESFNATARPLPEATLPELFEAQVARAPQATALVFGEESLTYQELNVRANRLAHHLIGLGVGPESLVGIALERSVQMVVALLGILKAGGAYLPIAVDLPALRRENLVADAGLGHMVTREGYRRFYEDGIKHVVTLDGDADGLASQPESNPRVVLAAARPAYVNYTSGSTGQPKGVLVPHGAVVRLVHEPNYVRLDSLSRLLQLAPLSFDAATFEIWGALLNGGTLVVMLPGPVSPENIGEVLTRHQVNTVWLTAGLFNQMVDNALPALSGVRQLLAGGEVLSVDHVQKVRAAYPQCQLINGYGPTENTTFSCCHRVPAEEDFSNGVPIGRPITNSICYVLDAGLEPMPIGVIGELYVAGAGLARGYLNRPGLTAERFVADPHAREPGTRMYRTGDLARWRADGTLEFLGRVDQQVKIRGFRIELGEIEAALSAQPAVAQAAVIAREDGPGGKQLVAYVVAAAGKVAEEAALRRELGQRLPDYMVPTAFVLLEALPLTASGKLDRRALPAPERHSEDYRGPRTPAEEVLCGLFAEVLKLERVSIEDNFFALGGHSLLATRLVSRVRTTLGVEVAIRTLFEAPTVAELAKRLNAGQALRPVLVGQPRPERLPLSYAQEGLWFTEQFQLGNCAYNILTVVRLAGTLNADALEKSLGEIVRRHEVLRTTFGWVDDNPVQVIAAPAAFRLPLVDLSVLPLGQRTERAQELAGQETLSPFDLAKGPLIRATLVRMEAQEHELLLTMHHIVSDGWSLGVLFEELSVLYAAFQADNASPLPELPMQYADYVCWQRQWLQGEVLAKQLEYWKQQLSGELPVLELPSDRPRPPVQSFRGASQSLRLPPGLQEGLRALGQGEGTTLFMMLLAAFQSLLHRYTAQEKIIVGAPVAGRNRVETEKLIGFFVNTMVLRTDLSGDPTFRELLKRVSNVCLEAYAHQDLPFERLVQELQTERSLSHTPLFNVMLNVVNIPAQEIRLAELRVEMPVRMTPWAKFDLTLYVYEEAQGPNLVLVYNADLFEPEPMSEMLEQLKHLIGQIVEAPDKTIGSYSLVTPRTRSLLPDPAAMLDEPRYELVTTTFASWATRQPNNIAIRQGERCWTYAQLLSAARVLAGTLSAQQLGKGDVVAVVGPRSFGLVSSMLAVWLSGQVVLPVDRGLPANRQRLMLKEAGVKGLVYIGAWRKEDDWIQENPKLVLICLDPNNGTLLPEGRPPVRPVNEFPEPAPDDPAYIFFTSGTTGTPKGVLGCHKGLSHFLTWQRETFAVGPQDRCAQLTNLSFDAVLRDIFLPLVSGATLCLPDDSGDLTPDRVFFWLEREAITLLHTVPSLAQSWLGSVPHGVTHHGPRRVFFAGEPLSATLVRRWREVFPESVQIVNLYGPTETTLVKCFQVLPAEIAEGVQPVGRPLPQTQALVLSKGGHLCGIGEPGEIVLRTPFRTLGYVNAPEEQRRLFVPNPFRNDPCDLLYHTGDRGRYRSDGSLEVLGRLDHQVKIRGVRVEPDEITATLSGHPSVRSCVVVSRKDASEENVLVAYVVAAPADGATLSSLRSYLQSQLPAVMVPSFFVFLDMLPLTPNGKVDRRALPAPQPTRPDLQETFVAPGTPTEEKVAKVWGGVFKLDRIGVHDNFFELGGHSLLATRVISRLRQMFNLELPLRILFEKPTVAELAEAIDRDFFGERSSREVHVVPIRRREHSPLSFAQEGLWFIEQFQPGLCAYNISPAVRLAGPLNVAALEKSLGEIVRRHEALRTTFGWVDENPVQLISAPAAFCLPLVDLTVLPPGQRAERAQELACQEARSPFDLVKGPLFRAALVRMAVEEYVLLLSMHHIVSDAWSVGVLFEELSVLYAAFQAGKASPLPELPIQYADYACWQRQWLQGEVLARQLGYWKQQLEGELPVLELPTDRSRPPVQSFQGASQSLRLPPGLQEGLRALGQREGATLFMTLLAAFQALLHRYTAQDIIIVGTPIANRNQIETEGLIGFFVNTLALPADLSGKPTFRELLGRVRRITLDAYTHQALPFEELVRELQPERDLSRTPLFQVMFVLQNTPRQDLKMPGLSASYLRLPTETAKFDLTLSMVTTEEGLRGTLEYCTDLFDASTIDRMLGHFQVMLDGIVANPDQRITELPLLTEAERHQLLVDWNDTGKEFPSELCIHQLFEAQVEQTPEAVAVTFEDKLLTYQELNLRANRLAHHLIGLGVGPESLVGIALERSIEMVVALLATLKAGGAYLPLDPNYPEARLAYMLADAAPALVLTTTALSGRLPQGLKNINLDALELQAALEEAPVHNPADQERSSSLLARHPAYVIYTAGSTGTPKGVVVEHRALANKISTLNDYINVDTTTCYAATTSISFDPLLEQILCPLCAGARSLIVPDSIRDDAQRFAAYAQGHALSVLDGTPGLIEGLLADGKLPIHLDALLIGGDVLSAKLANKLQSAGIAKRILNLYGPTEACIDASAHEVAGVQLTQMVPIGSPLANYRLYVLDTALNPVPIGVTGELYVAGAGLARGYLNRPGLTAERFVGDPHAREPGTRMYRTGDLARWRAGGALEFLGRADQQVKIRGFRIEPGEIEVALSTQRGVAQVAVIAREDAPGDKQLVAYVVFTPGEVSEVATLRRSLNERLPDYMVPAAFVVLDALPLTANGKLDRRALPAPERRIKGYRAPRTPAEEVLCGLFAEVLKLERVGIEDNFFALGGHSLLAMRLVSRVRTTLGVELAIRDVFTAHTLIDLSIIVQALLLGSKHGPARLLAAHNEFEEEYL